MIRRGARPRAPTILNYYKGKLAAEAVVKEALVPWTILRATQFYSLMDIFIKFGMRPPLVALLDTEFTFQPVDEAEVAVRLVEAAAQPASGYLDEVGGPAVRKLGELAQVWMQARGLHRPILRVPIFGQWAQGFRRGDLTTPAHRYGKVTWEQWLERTYRPVLTTDKPIEVAP